MVPTRTGRAPASAIPDESLEQSILLRFERMVELHAGNIAVQDHERSLTYRDLNTAANNLARILLELNGRGDAPVAFLLDHDVSAILTLMGILKTGRPYIALHTANPADRLHLMLSNAGAVCLISTRKYQAVVESLPDGPVPLHTLYLDDLALSAQAENPGIYVPGTAPYTINYTSGSTGDPKGLVLGHRNVNFCNLREAADWNITSRDRTTLVFSISFGAAYACIMNAFFAGGTLCLYDFSSHGPEAALEWVRSQEITILRVTPSMLRAMFERAPDDLVLPSLRMISLGGEAARAADAVLYQKHTAPHCLFTNIFASSEAGVVAMHTLDHQSRIEGEFLPAGQPIPGHQINLLDDEGQPVEPGQAGEIVIRSRYLHAGYWNLPELTARKYVSAPDQTDVKTFHTGDLGLFRPDGTLEFLGRKDSMVKIRGYRIETSEIELHLQSCPLLKDAAVVARPLVHRADQMQLIAYVVPRPDRNPDKAALKQFLSTRLPEYSIPSTFVFLDRLPLNPHGKVDKAALPELPDRSALSPDDQPSGAAEQRILEIWKDLLKLDQIGANDDFFELGGDSLLVLSMILEVEKALGRTIPPAFFKKPTIRNLATLLQQTDSHRGQPDIGPGTHWKSASFAHTWKRRARKFKQIVQGGQGARPLIYAVKRKYRNLYDEAFLFEWLLSRVMLNLPFRFMKPFVLWLAGQRIILHTVYRRKYDLFLSLLDSFGISPANPFALFRASFISNLMLKVIEAKSPFNQARRSNGKRTSSAYFRGLFRLVEETPADRLDEAFPVQGFHHLVDARQHRQGVILLSLHGTAGFRTAHRLLARRLGLDNIQVISHNTAIKPLRQGRLQWMSKDKIPTATAAPVYGEEAYRGQRLLQQGDIALIVADFGAVGPGRKFKIPVGDRLYSIKAGFAELALNTGAAVIPSYGRFTDDGRLLMEFLPPLLPGPGTRAEQIQSLIDQYAGFLNAAIKNHPEMLNWGRIAKHFRQPPALNP